MTLSVAPTKPTFAASTKKQRAKAAFNKAEQLRAALDGSPLANRKVADYENAARVYWSVYSIYPASAYAPNALLAIAEIHTQMGGDLKRPSSYRKAVKDYEFLIQQYPYSSLNKEALFTIGLIYQNDLNNPEAALKTFESYLQKYKRGPKIIAAKENIRKLKEAIKTGEKTLPGEATKQSEAEKAAELEDENNPGRLVDYSKLPRVTNIRYFPTSNSTRIVIDIDGEVQFDQSRLTNPDRIFFDLKGTRLSTALLGKTFPVEGGFLKEIRAAQYTSNVVRVVFDLDKVRDYTVFPLYNPYRMVIDVRGVNPPAEKTGPAEATTTTKAAAEKPPVLTKPQEGSKVTEKASPPKTEDLKEPSTSTRTAESGSMAKRGESPTPSKSEPKKSSRSRTEASAALTPHTARPNSDGSISLTRSLGLKIGTIVIDPGHGGHDYGTIGPGGLAEKNLALDVSLRLGKLLEDNLGSKVVYTRDDDTFVPLENRTALSNQKQADLFISVHANSSRNRSASGVETFYLGIASSHDQETLDVVARENAYSERSLHDLQDVIKKITLNEKVEESKEFAASVQKSMAGQISRWDKSAKNRGVKKAHFIVLIGANMPSILTEISFLSNPNVERMLKRPEYRQKIAQALYDGIFNYVKSLSGVKVAKKLEP
ncbi:MAG: N-acetylmuramoyl-L-alanine amidase [Acidobacteriia bacterium]|nr:N-acetylmuramoyl-L-alanine amidase [Terriglobia bacterium]